MMGSLQLFITFNKFHVIGLFLYPLETKSLVTSGFLMVSGGIERNQWHEMH